MEQPLVSVVVISYNQAKYIEQMLNSLKDQTYKNWELIVGDDCSQDNSVEVFQNWLQHNDITAKKIYHKTNTGVVTLLNEAVELCKGKYLKFIAADDYLHPDYLNKTVQCLEEKGEEYGMVFTDTYCIDENSAPLPDFADYDSLGNVSPEEFQKLLPMGNRVAALTVMMTSSAFKATGKYDTEFFIEDYYRWLKINEKYFTAYIPEKLTYYRLHPTNVSVAKAKLVEEETFILQMLFDKDGNNKEKFNDYFYKSYFENRNINKKEFSFYENYPFAIKRLIFCIKYKVPNYIFKTISKIV